jgi:cytochrome c oxidase cbb3-type subunit I/II
MDRPASTTPGSVMPAYTHLRTAPFDTALVASKMRALRAVGVPYTDGEIDAAPTAIETQARAIAAEVESQQGPRGLADKEITALTAYLQRLGTDIKWKKPASAPAVAPASTTVAAGAEAGAMAGSAPAPVK